MPQYRRVKINGSTFFFAVVLADRSSTLLIDEIDACGMSTEQYASVALSKPSQFVCFRTTFTRSGPYRRVMPILPPVGA